MLTLLDVNNFWSPTGGGVRRYQLEKINHYRERGTLKYVFVMPGDETRTEPQGNHVTIEHLPAANLPGSGSYRQLLHYRGLRRVIQRVRPDVIECGSPWIMPYLVRQSVLGMLPRPALVGFWHADFPRAYFGRIFGTLHAQLEKPAEAAGWWWAKQWYGRFDAVFCASQWVANNLITHGINRVYLTPLGVDTKCFLPDRRDKKMVERLQAGEPSRVAIFFPHRFSKEKGLRNLLNAYRQLITRVQPTPALVFAGTGPDEALVKKAAKQFPHVHSLGFLSSVKELATWAASCDVAVALSAFETFGLSTVEAMASGLAVVAANAGSSCELVEASGCGQTVPYGDTERLASALEELIREGRGRLRERGQLGRDYVLPMTWDNCFKRESKFYHEIVSSHREGLRLVPRIRMDL